MRESEAEWPALGWGNKEACERLVRCLLQS